MITFGVDVHYDGPEFHVPIEGYCGVQFWVDGPLDAAPENKDFHQLTAWFFEALEWMTQENIHFQRMHSRYIVFVNPRDAMRIKLRFG